MDQTQPGARAIDRGNDRLGDGERKCVRPGILLGASAFELACADCLQVVHVGAGAKSTAGAGEDDRPDVGRRGALGEKVEITAVHLGRPGIEPLRPIEREHGHSVVDFLKHHCGHAPSSFMRPLMRSASRDA